MNRDKCDFIKEKCDINFGSDYFLYIISFLTEVIKDGSFREYPATRYQLVNWHQVTKNDVYLMPFLNHLNNDSC